MKILKALLATFFLLATASCDWGPSDYGYVATANPTAQWHQALAESRINGKRVLIIAGGSWCSYCRKLDGFLKENADVDSALHDAFIVLKVYYGDDNYNEAFFARLDPGHGYPHFWVLDGDGGAIFSGSITEVEARDNKISRQHFLKFIQQYGRAPPDQGTL